MPMSSNKYRLVTRSDFDGLVCAVLLNELELIDEITFVHPKDMQDGKVAISSRDITTNLPYVPGAHLVFDHHESETVRNTDEMMAAVDQADSAQYSREDILDPQGWVLLNYLMDSRTGLGRFREFRISNYTLMMDLIKYCRDHTIEQILQLPDVQERVTLYFDHAARAKEQILRCATQIDNLVVLDLRQEETIWAVNRFMIYALFPTANISIHVMWGLQKQNTVLATGKSILDRSSKTHVGNLMLEYGGGGHNAAGTCQIANDRADEVLKTLVQRINADG